jgi:glutathione peroxidase-family protein
VLIAGDKTEAQKGEKAATMEGKMKGEMKGEMKAQATIDAPAPDFTLRSVDGKEYSLASLEGKQVVLEWVNFDCPFVKKHYSSGNIPELQEKYASNDEVVWLTICSSAPGMQGNINGDGLAERMESEQWQATAYLLDEDGQVGRLYGAKTTPHMFIIDDEGILRYAGAIDDIPSTRVEDIDDATNYVSTALDNIMADKAVSTKSSTPYGCAIKYAGQTTGQLGGDSKQP